MVDGIIQISIEGTDTRDYQVAIKVNQKIIHPGKLYNVMLVDNPGGYKNNDILVEGMNGYEVELCRAMYDKQDGHLKDESVIRTFSYDARDSVVVKLQNEPTVPPSSENTSEPSSQD